MTPATGTQVASKRKSSAAGLSGSGRPVKRRASKACHCCRSRKVRCDVVESGIPCTNCRLDEFECVVTEGKRRKKPYVEGDALRQSPIQSIEEKEDVSQLPIFDDIDGLQDLAVTTQSVKPESLDASNLDFGFTHHKPHMIYQAYSHRLTPEERTRRLSSLAQPPRLSLSTPTQFARQVSMCSPSYSRHDLCLPSYISPMPKSIAPEDLDYLQKKGVFFIPDVSIRNEMLRSYVQYAYPYLPHIDLQEFLTTIRKSESGDSVSLLLFQAVMFAATAYVDMRHLTAMGYTSRKTARKAFFERVKLLYDFDWEIDRVTVVQSVLLMTYWYESPADPKDVWHWLGIAVSMARTIGINYSTEESFLSPQKQRLWRRIWWSCYMRDRLVAIGMRRPIRIKEDDFNIPMLTPEDFETDAFPPELCRMLGGCSVVRDGSKRLTLARLCIGVLDVCKHITHVLTSQYSDLGHKIGVTSETTVRLVPKKAGGEPSEVRKCDRELEDWYRDLSLDLRFFEPGTRECTNNHDGEVISVHRALLTGIYLTASNALHRPQVVPVAPDLNIPSDLRELSKTRSYSAALDVTEMFRDLYTHDLIRYLPNTGVTILLPAIVIHLLNVKSVDSVDRQANLRHFHFCIQALHKLRENYSSADFAFSFLDAAARKANIPTAGLGTNNAASLSKRFPSTTGPVTHLQNTVLTPPPDTQDTTDKLLRRYDMSRYHEKTAQGHALTPPSSSERSHNSKPENGMALWKDLEDMVDMDGMADDSVDPFPSFSFDTSVTSMPSSDAQYADTHASGHNRLQTSADNATYMSDFDRLVNLEAVTDFLAPRKLNFDDNLFKDIDMEWFADPEPGPEPETSVVTVSDPRKTDHKTTGVEKVKQLETPELSDSGSDHKKDSESPVTEVSTVNNKEYVENGTHSKIDVLDQGQQEEQSAAEAGKSDEGFVISEDLDLDLTIDNA